MKPTGISNNYFSNPVSVDHMTCQMTYICSGKTATFTYKIENIPNIAEVSEKKFIQLL